RRDRRNARVFVRPRTGARRYARKLRAPGARTPAERLAGCHADGEVVLEEPLIAGRRVGTILRAIARLAVVGTVPAPVEEKAAHRDAGVRRRVADVDRGIDPSRAVDSDVWVYE